MIKGLQSRILVYLVWQLEQSENDNPDAKNWFRVARYDESYTLVIDRSIQAHVLVVKVDRIKSGTLVRFLRGAKTLCSPSAILRGTKPVSALTHALLYCT